MNASKDSLAHDRFVSNRSFVGSISLPITMGKSITINRGSFIVDFNHSKADMSRLNVLTVMDWGIGPVGHVQSAGAPSQSRCRETSSNVATVTVLHAGEMKTHVRHAKV